MEAAPVPRVRLVVRGRAPGVFGGIGAGKRPPLRKFLAVFWLATAILMPLKAHAAFFDPLRGGVCITDDDGEKYSCQKFLALAAQYRVKVSLGIVAQWVGDSDTISWDELRAGLDQGFLQVASHTLTHQHLTTLSDADLDWELSESKRLLELQLNTPIDTIFYPYGEYDARVLSRTRLSYKYGRRAYVGDTTGYNTLPFNFYELAVKSVREGDSPETVIGWVTEALQGKKLLILVFHTIVTGIPGEYEYNEADLEQIVRYVSENAPSLTISEAMQLRPPLEAIYPLLLGDD
jgi:peptidoglycan/xylan/chitin deacetylase (PgdA/CDA1 family)